MRHEMGNAGFAKIRNQLINISTQTCYLFESIFCYVEDNDVYLTIIFREIGADLNTYKRIRQVGYLKGAVDGIMVRYGHIIHPHFFGGIVYIFRGCTTLRAIKFPYRPDG